MAEKPYDLAIVGAGQAGCALAGKIAESGVNPANGEPLKIALLDRGPYIKGKPNPGYGSPLRRQMFTNVSLDFVGRYRHRFTLPPGETRRRPLSDGERAFTQGTPNIFGGGTLHYTARTHAPYPEDYEVWVNETGADWSYQNLKPFGEMIHRDFNIHARPKEMWVRMDYMLQDAARAIGYEPHDATLAKRNCLFTGYCDGTNMCKYDARQGSFIAYLPIAEERGLDSYPDSQVERILLEKQAGQVRVKGIEYIQNGVRQTLEVPRVIVSAGNYGNPPLLYRSGYGPRDLVKDLVVENPNVGAHTDNRPQLRGPTAVFDEPLSDAAYRHNPAQYVYHDIHGDPHYERLELSISANQLAAPDRMALESGAPGFGREHKEYMRSLYDESKMTPARRKAACIARASMHLVRPRNIRGYINEWGEQIYRGDDPSIVKGLQEGRELVYELFKKMGAREISGMDAPIRVRVLSTFVSSCIVGADPKTSVVNPYFESHDIDGLFICDASVVPRAATQGYAGTVATVAVFGASRIIDRHFKRG